MAKYNLEYFAKRTVGPKWGKVLDDDKYFTDEELMDNFLAFYCYAFSYLDLPAPTRAQLEVAQFVADRSAMNRLVWSMRSISKSLTSQIYVVWRLLNDPNEHILVASQSGQRAKNYTQFVKKLIHLLPITRPMYPRNNVERTASASFDVAGATASDSPSIYAVGVGNQVTGFRATMLIIDDVETSISVQSQALTDRTEIAIREMRNLLTAGKQESITLATPHSQNSIYLSWIEKGTKAFILPARYPEDDSIYMGYLAPYIKERITKDKSLIGKPVDERLNEDFLKTQEIVTGKSEFKLQYMLDVSDADELRFPLKLSDLIVDDVSNEDAPIKIGYSSMPDKTLYMKHNGFKKDRLYMPLYTSDERMEYDRRILSIDPSGRGKDKTGIAIIYMLNTKLFVRKLISTDNAYDDSTLNQISELVKLHKIDTVVIEANYGGGSFTKIIEPYVSESADIFELTVSGQKEVRIINLLEPLLNQHRVIIDKDTLEKDMNVLKANSFTYQLSHITREKQSLQHDDILDAVSNGVNYLVEELTKDDEFSFDKYKEAELEKIEEQYRKLFDEFEDVDSFGNSGKDFASVY